MAYGKRVGGEVLVMEGGCGLWEESGGVVVWVLVMEGGCGL